LVGLIVSILIGAMGRLDMHWFFQDSSIDHYTGSLPHM